MNEVEATPTSLTPAPSGGAAHQAIYRRWRAQTFAQMVGQEATVETLRNAVRLDKVAHAILFVGPRGTGKTSLARILAKALNCTDLQDGDPCDRCPSCVSIREGTTLDVIEIDAASNRGINEVKDLRDRLNYAPSQLRRKVYILDEAHQITKDAWNALLKSLEEPPDFVVFMFASTHPQEFPPAILSRLQRYDVRRLTVPEIEGKLGRILDAEARPAEPAAVTLIARLAAGGMRDAESMLDQLIASAPEGLTEARVRDLLGLAAAEAIDGFIEALVSGDARTGIGILDALEERGRDPRGFLDQVVDGLREGISAALAGPGDRDQGGRPVSNGAAALAGAARRLAQIDPNRAGIGGLRLQLELALLSAASSPNAPLATPRLEPETRTPIAAATAPAVTGAPETVPPSQPTRRVARVSPEPPPGPPPDPVSAPAPAPDPVSAPAPAPDPVVDRDAAADQASAPDPKADPKPDPEPAEPAKADSKPKPKPPPGPELAPEPRPAPATAAAPETATPVAEAPAPDPVGASDPAEIPGHAKAPEVAGAVDDLDRLRTLWPEIVAHISRHPPTKPLISVCRPITVEGSVVTLGFPEDQTFLREVAARRGPILEEGIGQYLGHQVAVRCVATNLDLLPALASDADGDFVLAEARRIFEDDLDDVGEVS